MKHLFFTYQWFIASPIILVATILTALGTILLAPFSKSYFGYYVPKWWARLWCTLMFVKVKVEGREKIDPKASYVFVANHQGAFDIFSIYGYLGHNFRWMMRKGLTNIPLVGQACEIAGHIMVDHHNAKATRKTMADAEKRLQNGMSIVVFPEATPVKWERSKEALSSWRMSSTCPLSPSRSTAAIKSCPAPLST